MAAVRAFASASSTPVIRCCATPSPSPSPAQCSPQPSLLSPSVHPQLVAHSTRTQSGRTRLSASASMGTSCTLESDALQYARSLVGPAHCSRPVLHFLKNCARLTSNALPTEDPLLTTPCLRTAVAEVLAFAIKQVAAVNSRAAASTAAVAAAAAPAAGAAASAPSTTAAVSAAAAAQRTPASSRRSFDFREDRRASVSLETYIFMWICQCDCDVELCLVALIYLDRLATVLPLTRQNCHRLWAAAMVAASKTYDDFVRNKRYAQIAGVPQAELNTLERNFLLAIDFRLLVRGEEWDKYRRPIHRLVVVQYTQGLCAFFAAHHRAAQQAAAATAASRARSQDRAKVPPVPPALPQSLGERIRVALARLFD